MKKLSILNLLILIIALSLGVNSYAQNPVNWTEKQLVEPADLANAITSKKDVPVIISVGPGATIPNSVDVGMVNTPEGLEKLKVQLKTLHKDKKIVVYCGCCPYEHCPNVRPAIDALKELKFTNYYLLDLPHNIKRDWIDKGYPVSKY
jgi:rhodanese-related sulfurtransferase